MTCDYYPIVINTYFNAMPTFSKSKFNSKKTNWEKFYNFVIENSLNTQNLDSEQKIDDENAIKIRKDPTLPKLIFDKINGWNKLESKQHKEPDVDTKKMNKLS